MKKLINWFKSLFAQAEKGSPEGISEFKSLVKRGLDVVVKYNEAKEDEKITNSEWLGIGRSAFPLIQNIRNWKLLKSQALDFTTVEGLELVSYMAELGIVGDDAQIIVKHTIAAIEKAYGIYVDDISIIIATLKN